MWGWMLIIFALGTSVVILAVKNKACEGVVALIGALFIVGGISVGLCLGLYCGSKQTLTTTITTTELVSLRSGDSIKGNFYLGSGVINNELTYVYYYKEDEAFKLANVTASNTLVYEENRSNGILNHVVKEGHGNAFQIAPYESYYEIYIPNNSILIGFELK